MNECKLNCYLLSTKLLAWTILSAVICAKEVVGQGSVNILKTGDYEDVSFAEPYKLTTLSFRADEGVNFDEYDEIKWHVTFVPLEDEIWPEYQQDVLKGEVAGHSLVAETFDSDGNPKISHMFKLPGTYKVSVIGSIGSSSSRRRQLAGKKTKATKTAKKNKAPKTDKSTKKPKEQEREEKILAMSDIRVRYGRRDVIDLSPTDWDNYVEAIWTLQELSSDEGKRRFNCPNFYNIDVFTTMHGVLSLHPDCDQNHFSLMQENAHHAWMTLLEKALQCVHPSIAMPFYNVAKDKRKYHDPEVGAKSMLDSPIFGPDYFGGGAANWDDREDPYDPYYVEDGRFANFPLRQNRTGLCDESVGLFDDEMYLPLCKNIMEEGGFKGFRSDDPTKSGMWLREPRDESSYKYVSARRWYLYKDAGSSFIPNFVPTHEMVDAMTTTQNAVEQYGYVSNKMHGYAHVALSGMWGGGVDETTLVSQSAVVNKGAPLLELLKRAPGLLLNFAWADETNSRNAGCYQCTKEGCEIDMENAIENNCYNINGGFGVPPDNTKPYWNDNAVEGNSYYGYLEQFNRMHWMKFAFYGLGTYHSNTGTFARHAFANQDPIFYVHHAFTFLLNDFGFRKLAENRGETSPFYGLDRIVEERGVPECPGQNPTDTSVYRNIVRYKQGQIVGVEQSWEHILEMWSEERRDYEWIINDEFITNYNETIRYDESCVDGCIDEALLIFNFFPSDGSVSREEMCQEFVSILQQTQGLTKEEACATKLKDIPELRLPFLPSRFDLYSYSCRNTCNYCKKTCGDPE